MRLLIIGPLNGQITTATRFALDRGAKVSHAETVAQGLEALRSGRGADLVMIDVKLDVRAFLEACEKERIRTPVLACGVAADANAAADAIRAGAREFIPLPPDAELIGAILAAISDDQREVIATDGAMREVLRLADAVASSDASILIGGESGVGKEVMARYVHTHSKRAQAPFIAVNCAAIPDNLLESELFGHEKGAFTGAVARRIGKFEEAHGGTLLLDEISEMDQRLQAKLLRALQERVIDRVGGSKPVPVDIRILATSNRDLAQAVREGVFRQDLLYRLNVVTLHIPPLRERRADILPLAQSFIEKFAKSNQRAAKRLSREAAEQVQAMAWRGNVRELENAMHRAVLLSVGEEIGVEAVRSSGGLWGANASDEDRLAAEAASRALVGRTVAAVEQELILETLDHCLGNRTHAAAILGISIRTLRNKLKLYIDAGLEVRPPPTGCAA